MKGRQVSQYTTATPPPRRRPPVHPASHPGTKRLALALAMFGLAPAATLRAQSRDSLAAGGDTLAATAPADTAGAPLRAFPVREIVVTATRLPMPESAVPAAVTVLQGASLQHRGIHDVAEALRAVPGATVVQTGSYGGATSLFLRGGESDDVQVLVDGVPINEPGGAIDLSTLSTDNLSRIEVVRGPASVLYGSDAVTGVVQLFTRTGAGAPAVRAHFGGGSYGTLDGGVDLSGGGPDVGYTLSVGRFYSAGIYDVNNQFRNDVASASLRLTPTARTDASLDVRASRSEYHYPTDDVGRIVDLNAFQTGDRYTAGAQLGQRLAPWLEARVLLGANVSNAGLDDRPDGPADTLGYYGYLGNTRFYRWTSDVRLNADMGRASVFTLGAALERQSEHSHDLSLSQYGAAPDSFRAHRADRAVYAQLVLGRDGVSSRAAGRRLTLTLGTRFDDNAAFGDFLTYRAGVAWAAAPHTRLRAAAGTAFKEPTLAQNYGVGYAVGNPDLRPERSLGWEVGVDRDLAADRVRIGVTWFDQQLRDLIDYSADAPEPGGPNYFNVARARASGLEASGAAALGPDVVLNANYTWLDAQATGSTLDAGPGDAFAPGEPLLRRPRNSANVALRARFAGIAADLGVRYVGRREDLDFTDYPATRVWLPAYHVLDLSLDRTLRLGPNPAPDLDLTLRVENLLGARYQEVLGFPARRRTILLEGRVGLGL
jgi:vitamin B12 transporter